MPGPDGAAAGPDAATARAAVDERRTQLARRLEASAAAQASIAALRVGATSANGAIRVQVSARGTLLDLQLEPHAAALPPRQLAAELLRTVQRAAAVAAEQVRALLEPVVPAGTDLDALVVDPALPLDDDPRPAGQPQQLRTDAPAAPTPADDEDLTDHGSWLRPGVGR